MKKCKSPRLFSRYASLLSLYKQVPIPWHMIILSMALSIGLKELESRMAPILSKIETGMITGSGFLLTFVVFSLGVAFVEAVQGSANELGSVLMTRNVQRKLWAKLICLPLSAFDRRDPQRFVSRVTQDTTGAYAAITVTVQIISVGYGIAVNFMRMYRLYKTVALVMLSGIPMTLLSSWIMGKLEYRINEIVNTSTARITNFFGERLPNLMHIKSSRMEEEEYRKGVEESEKRYRAEVRKTRLFIIQMPVGTFAQYINEIILLLVASVMVRAGTMKMAQMINLYNYFLLFMGNAMMLSAIWVGIQKSLGSCETIAPLMQEPLEKLDGEAMEETPVSIGFEHVSFSYEENKQVLNDVSFTIPQGKITAIVGENGCGKTTIIKLLEHFIVPGSGAIRLGDRKLEDISLSQWRDAVGYLPQSDVLVKGSIRENISYGLNRAVTDEEIEAAARKAQAWDFICEKEEGLDTQVSHFSNKLSGGEQQRIAIARMLLKQPKYLIMDEATSGIDVVTEAEVFSELCRMMQGGTMIVISHDMNLVRKADHIIVLNNGCVEACGTYEEVSANSTLFNRFTETNN